VNLVLEKSFRPASIEERRYYVLIRTRGFFRNTNGPMETCCSLGMAFPREVAPSGEGKVNYSRSLAGKGEEGKEAALALAWVEGWCNLGRLRLIDWPGRAIGAESVQFSPLARQPART